jgi:hypothetical protein
MPRRRRGLPGLKLARQCRVCGEDNWRDRGSPYGVYCLTCHGRQSAKLHRRYRREVLEHYGGVPPQCACCGENVYEFLALDHLDGGGTQHLLKLGVATIYHLVRRDWPEEYQVLCHNCNFAKGAYGKCPHQNATA